MKGITMKQKIETGRYVKSFRGRVVQCRGRERSRSGYRFGLIGVELDDGTKCVVWLDNAADYRVAERAHEFNKPVLFVAERRDLPIYEPLFGLSRSILD